LSPVSQESAQDQLNVDSGSFPLEATSPADLFFRLIRDIWQIGQSVAKNPGAPAQFLSSCYCVVEIEFDKAHNLPVIFYTAAGTAVASPHGLAMSSTQSDCWIVVGILANWH
jgi:hypothetical protein